VVVGLCARAVNNRQAMMNGVFIWLLLF